MISDVNSTLNIKSETTGQTVTDRIFTGTMNDKGEYFWRDGQNGRWLDYDRYIRTRIRNRANVIRKRAKDRSIPYDLTFDYLLSIFPEDFICPVFGIKMEFGGKGDGLSGATENSPSIDRIIPELGYVKGNVIWVSSKANCMKSTGSVADLFTVAQFYQRLLHNPSLFMPGSTIH